MNWAYGLLGAIGLAIGGYALGRHHQAAFEESARNAALVKALGEKDAKVQQSETNLKATQDELSQLRQHAADYIAANPVRPVRLCVATNRSVPTVPGSTGVDTGPGRAELPQESGSDLTAGPDIGPSLYAEADRADSCAISLRGWQSWYERERQIGAVR